MKRIRIVIVLFVFLLIIMITGCNCNSQKSQFRDYNFIIGINSNYKDTFKNRLFTLEDFDYENVDHFVYGEWFDKQDEGYMVIYLKKTGIEEVRKAMEHFEKLDFVKYCELNAIVYALN